ncbi:MAG: diadenosine tetraphosphatase [Bacteroidetes bacterium ADurb.Bin141]|nr:MAG: diadenosine tetraphosphatase [Bacteroidetes bacterium ADurb.Bin141]
MKIRTTLLAVTLLLSAYFANGADKLQDNISVSNADSGLVKTESKDDSHASITSEGPIIVYENKSVLKYQIYPKDTGYFVSKKTIQKKDTLTCYISETNDRFQFQLKNKLKTETAEYALPEKMLIISDIEGNFKGFKSILLGNKIIDSNFHWTFGKNHLVLVGDFFDRGINVSECLWLIYKLEQEAEQQGGKVHFILGNHEIMNLQGNLKYVRSKYFKNADTLHLAYKKWFAQNTEAGRWLRTKNAVEKIGDYVFVHAGISKNFPEKYSLQEINSHVRKSIDKEFTKEERRSNVFIGHESPIWYRGIAKKMETQQDVEKTLNNYHAAKMIIGHTIFEKMQYLYNQKIIAIDLEHQENSDKGMMYALWFENNNFMITDQNGKKESLK